MDQYWEILLKRKFSDNRINWDTYGLKLEEPCHVCKVLISGTGIKRIVYPEAVLVRQGHEFVAES